MDTVATTFDSVKFLQECAKFATKNRQKLLRQLVKKAWFQATDPSLQMEVANLPQSGSANCDGFIENLIRRDDIIGDIKTNRLLSLPRGNFILCPVFEVESTLTHLVYTYEYAAYRYAVPTGAKGLVFVRENREAEPTHFIILSGEKFATSEMTYELMGGFADTEGDAEVTSGIVNEIQEETGVKNLEIDEIILLGTVVVDPGLSSHEAHLYAAYITPKEAKRISVNAKNIDDKELTTYVHVLPLSALPDVLHDTTNGILLATATKAYINGLIPKQFCIKEPSSFTLKPRKTTIRI